MNARPILILIVLVISGCATIGSKGIHKISLSTLPEGAEIKVYDKNNLEVANTSSPDTLFLKPSIGYFKRAEYYVHISKEGYLPRVVPIYFVMNQDYMLNVYTLFFMPIGLLLVDPVSGAMWTPERTSIEVSLIKEVP